MAVKLHLISSLVAVLVICVIADLPTEGNDVLDSNVELESFDSGFALQDNIEEINNLRQMREAIAEPKKSSKDPENQKKKNGNQKPKTKGEQNPSRRKGNKSKRNKRKGSKKTNPNGKRGSKRKGKKAKKIKGKTGNKRKGKKGKKAKQSRQKSKANRKRKGKKTNKNKQKSNNNQNRKAKKKSKSKSKTNGQRNQKSNTKSKGKKSESTRSKSKGGEKSGKGKKGGGKSKKEGKRSKKGGRRLKKKRGQRKSNGKPRQTTATVNLTCLRDAVTYTKFLKDNVINFLRRNTRLTAQTATTNKKAAKKGEFKEPAARLIQSGGGDKTNLSCSGSTTSVGAKKIKSLTDKLDACEISIKNTCKPPSSINSTTLATCQKNAIAFNKTVSACIVKATKGQDACSCFQDAEVAKEKKVLQSCKGTSEAKAAAKARTACLKVISGCKNASTEAATIQYACSYSTDHLLKTLKQLTANLATFGALIDKIKELTGLSPTVGPGASNSTTGRQARSDEEKEEEAARLRGKRQQQECSTITTTITTCTTTISNKPASADVVTSCKAPTFTIGTCSAADKTAIVAQLNDAIDKNAIIIAFIASVVAELKAITGTTPKASDLTSATAKASARSRSVLRKMIMEKMNLRN